eukprot:3200354-Rhodomonas_salina.1
MLPCEADVAWGGADVCGGDPCQGACTTRTRTWTTFTRGAIWPYSKACPESSRGTLAPILLSRC